MYQVEEKITLPPEQAGQQPVRTQNEVGDPGQFGAPTVISEEWPCGCARHWYFGGHPRLSCPRRVTTIVCGEHAEYCSECGYLVWPHFDCECEE